MLFDKTNPPVRVGTRAPECAKMCQDVPECAIAIGYAKRTHRGAFLPLLTYSWGEGTGRKCVRAKRSHRGAVAHIPRWLLKIRRALERPRAETERQPCFVI